jgi:hypothetical protein
MLRDLKRLSIKQLFGISETKILEDYYKDVQRVAATLTGKDKVDFLLSATKNTPKGTELNDLAAQYSQTPSGLSDLLMTGLNNEFQKVTEDEVSQLILHSNQEEQVALMAFISGNDPDVAVKSLQEDKDKKKLATTTPTI